MILLFLRLEPLFYLLKSLEKLGKIK
jgi:hypothetical protein